MRSFLTASICFALLLAGFGCADKKGPKASLRKSGARVTDQSKANGGAAPGTKQADGSVASEEALEDLKSCENTVATFTPSQSSTPVSSLADLVDTSVTDKEYVLESVEAYSKKAIATKAAAQIHIRALGYVSADDPGAIVAADEKTELVCDNSALQQKTVTENKKQIVKTFSSDPVVEVTFPNAFGIETGNFTSKRKIFVSKAGGIEQKIENTFLKEQGSLKDENAQDLLLKDAPNAKSQVSLEADGTVIWRLSNDSIEDGKKVSTWIVAIYKKQDIAKPLVSAVKKDGPKDSEDKIEIKEENK